MHELRKCSVHVHDARRKAMRAEAAVIVWAHDGDSPFPSKHVGKQQVASFDREQRLVPSSRPATAGLWKVPFPNNDTKLWVFDVGPDDNYAAHQQHNLSHRAIRRTGDDARKRKANSHSASVSERRDDRLITRSCRLMHSSRRRWLATRPIVARNLVAENFIGMHANSSRTNSLAAHRNRLPNQWTSKVRAQIARSTRHLSKVKLGYSFDTKCPSNSSSTIP